MIVSTMATASLYEVVKEAATQRKLMIARADAGRESLIATANAEFVRAVTGAAASLTASIQELENPDDDYDYDDDGSPF